MNDIEPFANELVRQIRKDLNDFADDMASGGCKSFEEYRFLCGMLRGLDRAEAYIKDLAKQVKEANE